MSQMALINVTKFWKHISYNNVPDGGKTSNVFIYIIATGDFLLQKLMVIYLETTTGEIALNANMACKMIITSLDVWL